MMIVKDLNTLENERIVKAASWVSNRLVLKEDGMGFSFNITTMFAGTETQMHYKNHLESCFILEGSGWIETCATGELHELKPGVIYLLDQNDEHVVRPDTDIRMACVFNPALTGCETHRPDGSYAVAAEASSL